MNGELVSQAPMSGVFPPAAHAKTEIVSTGITRQVLPAAQPPVLQQVSAHLPAKQTPARHSEPAVHDAPAAAVPSFGREAGGVTQ